MDIKNEIIKTIEVLIDKKISSTPTDIPTVVVGVRGDKYQVNIDGATYYVKDGVGIAPKIGTAVWLRCPNGDIKAAYIAARR